MAARPGEENVATLFADIHYFYSPANVKPRHHRFDKGSYVYLFENAGERRCRIEIANNAGTEDQDAFYGFLDQAHVRYSYKQHCAVSLTVADTVDQSEWHLPTYDPRNENKYHYKLHSLDIYFWTQQDALQFVNGVRRVLPPAQVEVLDEPDPPPQPAGMSAVIQKLESAAISDPQYSNGALSSQSASQSSVGGHGDVSAVSSGTTPSISMPPPPPPPQAQPQPQPASFAPMAYNPAAPAAPETIRHREKTPPPDEDPLNPLAVAVAYDYRGQPFTPGIPPPSHFPPSGVTSPGFAPPQFAASPVHPGIHRATTMPAQGLPSPGLPGTYGAGFPASPGLPPPPASQPPMATQGLASPPPGGFSNYSYSQQPGYAPSGSVDYSIHQQVYRPTEAEASHKYQPKQEGKGKLEENAGRLERGVTGMLKKFEKKFG